MTKRFGLVTAVYQSDLFIADGEFVTLVGPSGCGKSTTLHMIAGLEKPTAGKILVGGQEITSLHPGQRDLALVFQSYALYPHLNVFENLAFPLRVRKQPNTVVRQAVEQVASTLGIGTLLQRRPRELSGGQRQRVALGRALIRQPKAFLLDEPLSNLDAALRLQMRTEMKLLFNRLGATVVLVTHDQAEAMTMSDRIVVMQAGRIEQVGTPREIYSRPQTIFVASFIGSPQMNLWRGEVVAGAEGAAVRGPWFDLPLPAQVAAGLTAGSQVTVGMRPEDITLGPADGRLAFPGRVALIEDLGSETLVFVEAAGGPRLTVAGQRLGSLRVSDNVSIGLRPEALHFFDERGRRLGG